MRGLGGASRHRAVDLRGVFKQPFWSKIFLISRGARYVIEYLTSLRPQRICQSSMNGVKLIIDGPFPMRIEHERCLPILR